jgi:hypothetical protein
MKIQTLRAFIKKALPKVRYKKIDNYLVSNKIIDPIIVCYENPSKESFLIRKQAVEKIKNDIIDNMIEIVGIDAVINRIYDQAKERILSDIEIEKYEQRQDVNW